MSRWIDADAIDYKFEETFDEEKMEYLKPNTFADGAVWVMRRIKEAPSIDIVRCQDCKHWNSETNGCKRNPSVEAWRADDFCSYGERAEQTEPNCSEKPNNCDTCKWGEWYRKGYDITMMSDECGGCCSWNNKWTPKDEPQTDCSWK